MGRRRKLKKQSKWKALLNPHSNDYLDPEFDEINKAALGESNQRGDFRCSNDGCKCKYINQTMDKGGQFCIACKKGKLKLIKLNEAVKTGKKSNTNWSNTTGSTHAGATTYKPCDHPGKKIIFEWEGKKLYASNSHSLDEGSNRWELIIDLAGVAAIPKPALFIGEGPAKYKDLRKHLITDVGKFPEVLRLHWTDMGIPPVTLGFWMDMWKLLPEKTVICCFGGHGRTGTCLASLMIAAGVDYYSAITTVRTEHCDKAIESLSQEEYLWRIYCDMLNLELKAAKDDADLTKEITEDLLYAQQHKPNYQSSYGDPIKEDKKKTTAVGTSLAPDIAGEVVGEDKEIKEVGGKVYVKECRDPKCMEHECSEPSHMGWVEWDLSQDSWDYGYGAQGFYGH